RVALCRGDDDVGIFRIDHYLVDLRRLFQADVRPGLTRIDRFVHAVAGRTLHRVTGACIDDVRIGWRYLNGADTIDIRKFIENGKPRDAPVSRFPNAADRRTQIENDRLADDSGDGGDTPAMKRANVTPAQTIEEVFAWGSVASDTSAY